MMDSLVPRDTPVELSTDERFAGRVRRLAITAVVALGAIWWLAVATLSAPAAVDLALLLGWILMPAVLWSSLQRPAVRYALVLPSTLVGLALVAISAAWLPASAAAAAGWSAIMAGVLLGGLLGIWFWFRLLPVPASLDDPFAPGRLVLIGLHVALIVAGIALAATALVH